MISRFSLVHVLRLYERLTATRNLVAASMHQEACAVCDFRNNRAPDDPIDFLEETTPFT